MVVCTLPHFSPLKLGSFAVLSKTFFLGKNRETIIVQNVFSLGNYAKPSQVKNQKHFFLGSVVKLLPIKNIISPGEIHIVLTLVPLFGNLKKKNGNRNKDDKGGKEEKKNKI